jgi:D-threo-aldose 1-dehydrogenase
MVEPWQVNRLGFGCGGLMRSTSSDARRNLLDAAFDCGIRYFDVARMYGLGQTEAELGRFARGKRDQLIIATKFGIEPTATVARWAGMQKCARMVLRLAPALKSFFKRRVSKLYRPKEFSAAVAQRSLDASLSALQTDYVDLYLLHEPTPADFVSPDIIPWLEKAKAAGKIREWGIAGELDESLSIRATMPGLGALLQIPNDILNRNVSRLSDHDKSRLITFSPFSRVVEGIKQIDKHAWHRAALAKKLDVDLAQPDSLSHLLLAYCVRANSKGVTLFATSNQQRLKSLIMCVNNAKISNVQLDAFVAMIDDLRLRDAQPDAVLQKVAPEKGTSAD